jgi:hypothetical protein
MSHIVKATREGLVGQETATGWKIDTVFPFVALPSERAKMMWIWVRNPLNGMRCCAQVRDVGPHNTQDDAYVFGDARPAAESGTSDAGPGTAANTAGIDLGEAVWQMLGMKDNTEVEWGQVFPQTIT